MNTQQTSPWATKKTLDSVTSDSAKAKLDDQALYTAWKRQPGPKTLEPILDGLRGTIDSGLSSFAPGAEDTLRTRAKILAVRALETYDPNMGTKLNTHVYNSLQKLFREKADRENIIHVPENVMLEKGLVDKASKDFESNHGRQPAISELADKTGLSAKRLGKISKYRDTAVESQFLSEKGDTLFSTNEDPNRMWLSYVYHDLDPIDKKVFEWSTGYGGTEKLPKKEIAMRLRISAPAVSSRINKMVKQLEAGYAL